MPPNAKPHVFIVEDDDAVRASLTALAEARGWQVTAFDSAIDFLDGMPAAGPGPACLVLDLQMPEMNGAELAERLQSEHCQIPTLVITAWPESELARRARKAGVAEVISKPFAPSEWVKAVERVFETRH